MLVACADGARDPATAAEPQPFDDAHVTVGAPDDAGVAAGSDAGVGDDDLPDTVAEASPTPPTTSTTARPAPPARSSSAPLMTAALPVSSATTATTRSGGRSPPPAHGRKIDVDAALAQAQRLYVSGRFADAIATLAPAERHAPDDARLHRLLGLYNAKLRRIDEARLHLARYLELAPDAPDAARVRAQLDRL